jgi:transcriptional regulator with XRE-family HTH domain
MLHELIKAYQEKHHLHLQELADRIGISMPATWRLLHQKPLNQHHLRTVIRWVLAGPI